MSVGGFVELEREVGAVLARGMPRYPLYPAPRSYGAVRVFRD